MIIRPIVCRTFIGRGDELAYLHERRREAGASHGGLVLVSGEAGIGKSRLLAQFCASQAKSRWRIGVGRCLEFAQRPYGPIVEVLSRFGADAAALAPAASKREQFEAIAGAFEDAASRSAIIAVVEDLHWADAASAELLTFLSARLTTQRILLIVSFRPEEFHPEHPSYASFAKLGSAPNAGRIDLPPLEGVELRHFIDDALAEIRLPEDVRRAVATAGDGNPFFVEELLKSAVERSSSAVADPTELPSTVRVALMERLRPLGPEERRILAQAAVIGRTFDVATLAATLDTKPDPLLAALHRARRLQLIVETSPATFRFRHALTREAMYGDFLAAQVQPMHRTIAMHIASAPPDDTSLGRLAYHWWAAGDTEQAARYNELAGDAAVRLHAHADAAAFYERAAAVAGFDAAQRARVFEKIAERRLALGSHVASLTAYSAAADLFRTTADVAREAACRVRAAHQAYSLGQPDPTVELEAMLDRLEPNEYVTRSRIHLGIAWITATFYRPAEALRHIACVDERAVAAEPDIGLRYHNVRAWVFMTLGDADAFREEHAAWLDAARTLGGDAIAQAHYNGAFCYSLFGFHDEALRNIDDALRVAREVHSRHAEAAARAVSAFCHLLAGNLAAVRSAIDAMRALQSDNQVTEAYVAAWGSVAAAYLEDEELVAYCFDQLGATISPFAVSLWAAGYAEILVRRGRAEEARALLSRAIDIGDRPRGNMLSLLAVARYGAAEDAARARAALVTVADAPGEPLERYAVELFDAIVAHRGGRHAEAHSHAAAAATGFGRLRVPLLQAEALELAGDRDGALAIFRTCGAAHDVRRLEPKAAAAATANVRAAAKALLSVREREIAALVAQGKSNLVIGHVLGLSHKTVEKHLGSAFAKLGFSSRAQLGAYVSGVSGDGGGPSG